MRLPSNLLDNADNGECNLDNSLNDILNDELIPEKENLDPAKKVYSPRAQNSPRAHNPRRYGALRDITDNVRPINYKIKDIDTQKDNGAKSISDWELEKMFNKLEDSPIKKRNGREI